MADSGEVFVLGKVAELAQRCGLDPTREVVHMRKTGVSENALDFQYELTLIRRLGLANAPSLDRIRAYNEGREKFLGLLGLTENGPSAVGEVDSLHEFNERLDRALTLVPPVRATSRRG